MKHLLKILSILLLSSPVIGDNHKGETLYGWGKCCDYVWKAFGDEETHGKYTGYVKNGKPNGLGVMIFPYGGWKYVGGWKDGKWNGQGKESSPYGDNYEGEFKDVVRHGLGTSILPNGRKYVGEWKDGKEHGQGTNIWTTTKT